jgi:hypothetical protein
MTVELSAQTWALLECALADARHRAQTPMTDAEALEAVVRDALASRNQGLETSDAGCAQVLPEGEPCGESEVDTGASPAEVGPAAARCLDGPAREHRMSDEGRDAVGGAPFPAAMRQSRPKGCASRMTHGRRQHAGQRQIAGDAPLGLACRDAMGEPPARPDRRRHAAESPPPGRQRRAEALLRDASRAPRSRRAAGGDVTERAEVDEMASRKSHLGTLNDDATRLLRIIGRRRHWTPDELCEQSGLSFPELQHALLLLELDGRIRRASGLVDPV